jgi:energy-coupling factor transporter transmembrane protein EcfT
MEEKKKEIDWGQLRKWTFVGFFFLLLIFVFVRLGVSGTIGFFLFLLGFSFALFNFKRKDILGRFFLFFGISFFVLGFLLLLFSWFWVFFLFPVILGWFLLIAYWYLAPENRWFTKVKEGTAKVVVRGGKFKKALLNYTGYHLDENWNLVEGELSFWERLANGNLFGGLYLYSLFHPIDDIYIYNFKWSHLTESGDMKDHEEILDYILVSDYPYALKAEGLEDKNGAELDLIMVITIRIINIYKPLFRIQTRWLAATLNRIVEPIASVVATNDISYWMDHRKELTEKINEAIQRPGDIFQILREEYGVEIKRIEVKEVIPEEKMRETILTPFVAKKKAEGVIEEAHGERKKLEEIGAGHASALEAKIRALATSYPTVKELLSDLIGGIEKIRGKKVDLASLLAKIDKETIETIEKLWRGLSKEEQEKLLERIKNILGGS